MKILIVAHRFHTNLYYRALSLQKAGHTVRVVSFRREKAEFHGNIKVTVLHSWPLLPSSSHKWNVPFGLQRIVDQFKPDCILMKAYQDMLSLSVCNMTRARDIPVIGLLQTKKKRLFGSKALLKWYFDFLSSRGVVGYITPVRTTQKMISSLGVDNVVYAPFVYPPVRTSRALIKSHTKSGMLRILCVGKMVPRKSQDLLLEALKDVKGQWHLTLVGEKRDLAYFDTLRAMVQKHSLPVTFKNVVSYTQMPSLYKAHDVFVLPSTNEPAAYSPVEAFAHGLPVICSDSCGTSCYVMHGKNGYVFRSGNVASLKRYIQKFFDTPKLVMHFSQSAAKAARTSHTLSSFSQAFSKVMRH